MRVRLAKGKQTELILAAKREGTWRELATRLGFNSSYLSNELAKEKRFLSNVAYLKLCKLAGWKVGEYIIEELEDNWGKAKGGKNSNFSLAKKIAVPRESVRLAEFYGIMLGDGNLTKIKGYKVGTYQIRIVGDSRYDKEYLLNYVKPLIESLFRININSYEYKTQNALSLTATGRELVKFLEEKGFKPGNKIDNALTIPSWIAMSKKYLIACLRGLYDTDGGVYRLTNQNSIQIGFKAFNRALLEDVRIGLVSLDINPSRIINENEIRITKKSELRKFLKRIGFSNQKHLKKVKRWKELIYSPIV